MPESGVALVGSAPSNDIVLDHPDVSRHHCVLAARPGGRECLVIDGWSRTGTLADGRPVGKDVVGVGAVVRVGPFELELIPGEAGGAKPLARDLAGGRPAAFELAAHDGAGGRYLLGAGSVALVGRAAFADVRVNDDFASELHCLVALDPSDNSRMPYVVDLRSSNGTRVNGQPIHRSYVAPRDKLTVGRLDLRVREREESTPEEPTQLVVNPAETVRAATAHRLASTTSYAGYFGFEENPFATTADPDFLFLSRRHKHAVKRLVGWLRKGWPVAALVGEPGCGKSLLVACLARHLSYRKPPPIVLRPHREYATVDDLIMAAVAEAAKLHRGLSVAGTTPLEVWYAATAELRKRNTLVAFLFDDADALSEEFLVGLAALLETDAAIEATRILLAGPGSLRDLVAREPLASRLGAVCRLAPLEAGEVEAYVSHRLRVASGRCEALFTPDALELIVGRSRGVPRLVNIVTDAALFCACRDGLREVGRDVVERAVQATLGTEP